MIFVDDNKNTRVADSKKELSLLKYLLFPEIISLRPNIKLSLSKFKAKYWISIVGYIRREMTENLELSPRLLWVWDVICAKYSIANNLSIWWLDQGRIGCKTVAVTSEYTVWSFSSSVLDIECRRFDPLSGCSPPEVTHRGICFSPRRRRHSGDAPPHYRLC